MRSLFAGLWDELLETSIPTSTIEYAIHIATTPSFTILSKTPFTELGKSNLCPNPVGFRVPGTCVQLLLRKEELCLVDKLFVLTIPLKHNKSLLIVCLFPVSPCPSTEAPLISFSQDLFKRGSPYRSYH